MNDIKFFLLIAFFIVVGIVKTYNKTKRADTSRPAVPDERGFGDESDDKEFFPQPSPSNARKTVPTASELTVHSIAAMNRDTTRMNFTKPSIDNEAHTIAQSQTSCDDLESEQSFSISSPEDAKRAIIWSEILQRKYSSNETQFHIN
ncbi:hypothetical protein EZS27_026166 [termite gut metagenome]|uniref:Uncharacterized protein n=1 Tax=termite gut metagenome TaxID=433724 RepID=A0A5J4QUE9_9ZZZZ